MVITRQFVLIIRGKLELKLTTSGYGLKGQTAQSPGQRSGNIRRHQFRPARAKAHPQVNAIAKYITVHYQEMIIVVIEVIITVPAGFHFSVLDRIYPFFLVGFPEFFRSESIFWPILNVSDCNFG